MDDKTRLDLYRMMVLSRTFEEAILREYHADKRPGFDIGRGSSPARCTCPPARSRWPPASARTCAATTRSPRPTARTTSRSRTAWTWTG